MILKFPFSVRAFASTMVEFSLSDGPPLPENAKIPTAIITIATIAISKYFVFMLNCILFNY